jgi:hypothetical protein
MAHQDAAEALIFAGRELWKGWTVMDRLGEITVPTLVLAGRDDFQFPPEHQVELAAGIPNARLEIIERAGHNAHSERPAEVMEAVKDFISADAVVCPGRCCSRRRASSRTRSPLGVGRKPPTGAPPTDPPRPVV